MKISDILEKRPTVSFEVFPPTKSNENISSVFETVEKVSKYKPDFISVTYGAMGSDNRGTLPVVDEIQNVHKIESVAHITAVGNTPETILAYCKELKEKGIRNILCLRGDYPKGYDPKGKEVAFRYAADVVAFIREHFGSYFCLSGACYPEIHPEASSLKKDLENLRLKVDSGLDYLITQIFFDNNYYYRLKKEAKKARINVPIIAGIMPAVNASSLRHISRVSRCSIPFSLSTLTEKYAGSKDAMREIGINFAIHQIIELIANDADGVHLYTMNKPDMVMSVFDAIPTMLKEIDRE